MNNDLSPQLKVLKEQLKAEQPLTRIQVCEDLAVSSLAEPKSLAILCEALTDSDCEVRQMAYRRLAQAGPSIAVALPELARSIVHLGSSEMGDLNDEAEKLCLLAFRQVKEPRDLLPIIFEFRKAGYCAGMDLTGEHLAERDLGPEFLPLVEELLLQDEPNEGELYMVGMVLSAIQPPAVHLADRAESLMNEGFLKYKDLESDLAYAAMCKQFYALAVALKKIAPGRVNANSLLQDAVERRKTVDSFLGKLASSSLELSELAETLDTAGYESAELNQPPSIEALLSPETPPLNILPDFKRFFAQARIAKSEYLPSLLNLFQKAKELQAAAEDDGLEADDIAGEFAPFAGLRHRNGMIERALYATMRMKPCAFEAVEFIIPIIKEMVDQCSYEFPDAFRAIQEMGRYASSKKKELILLQSALEAYEKELAALTKADPRLCSHMEDEEFEKALNLEPDFPEKQRKCMQYQTELPLLKKAFELMLRRL